MKLNALVPMLPVKSIAASVAFYEKLGFVVGERNDEWRWARLECGDCTLMVDESINVHPSLPRMSVLYFYPDDIVAFHAQAKAAGLDVPALEKTFYGMREFRLDDPDGNRLWVGQEKD